MEILSDYFLDTYWDILMVKCFALMKESNWDYLVVKSLALYLEMYTGSYLELMFEQRWDL